MIKIGSNYVDIFKDTYLMISLMQILGGPAAILFHPTQFSSVIVMSLAATIALPLMASGLHIAINNPTLLFKLQTRRSVTIVVCLVSSVLTPILLINLYEAAKEKTRKLSRNFSNSRKVPCLIIKCNIIKNQLVEFLRIELGRYLDYI